MKKKCSEQCFCDGSCKEDYVKSDVIYNQKPIRISSFTNVLHITETENILNFRTEDFSVSKDGFEKFHFEEHFTDVVYNGKLLKEDERKELWSKLFNSAQKMIERTEMTYQEKYDMYMSVEKETLVEMLIEANKHLDRLTKL